MPARTTSTAGSRASDASGCERRERNAPQRHSAESRGGLAGDEMKAPCRRVFPQGFKPDTAGLGLAGGQFELTEGQPRLELQLEVA
jgi:hypothetical protein